MSNPIPPSNPLVSGYATSNPQKLTQRFARRVENVAYSHGLKPGGLNQKNDHALSRDEILAAYNAKGSNLLNAPELALTNFLSDKNNFNALSGQDGKLLLKEVSTAVNAHRLLNFLRLMLAQLSACSGNSQTSGTPATSGTTGTPGTIGTPGSSN